jgi:predicted nucleotidyltransferase
MITKDNNYKVMKLFFDSPEKTFHIREIARRTGLSSPGAIKIIKRLKGEKLLNSQKSIMTEEVGADMDGRFMPMKRAYNLHNVLESGLIEMLKDFYEEPRALIMFGSYSNGTDNSMSDIDIAIETKSEKLPDARAFEKKLRRKISLYPFTKKTAGSEFKNSIANGIVLDGFLEVI